MASGRALPGLRLLLLTGLTLSWVSFASALQWELQSSDAGDIPVPNGGDQQTACVVGDLDGDGVDDIIIGERTLAPAVVVYFLRGSTWVKEVIEPAVLDVEAGGDLADIDGDGDLDLVLGGDDAINEIWWWENPGSPPYPSGWTRRLVKNSGQSHQHDQVFGDFDGDGELELVFWNRNDNYRLYLADVPADPLVTEPWPRVEIFAAPERAEGLTKADIDLNGKIDIVGGGYWFEHVGGYDYTAHLIEAGRTYTRTVVDQFVPGGRPEIVLSPGDDIGPLRWYQWLDDAWQVTELDPVVRHGHSLSLGDVDQNGLPDFFVAEMHSPGAGDNARSRVFLNQGDGVFSAETVSVGIGNHESRLADIDNDGLLDIVGKPFNHDAPGLNVWFQVPVDPPAPDTLAAEIRWIRATDPDQVVHLQFSEPVTESSATDALNFNITGGVQVLSAVLAVDQRTVRLSVSGLVPGFQYSCSTQGVADLADPANLTDGSGPVLFRFRPWPRDAAGLQALYDFDQNGGGVVFDVKADGIPFDLDIPDTTAIAWTGGGLELVSATTLASLVPVTALTDACVASGEITIEAWIQTAALDQNGPARMVTISQDAQARNVTLGQGLPGGSSDQYVARFRTTTTDLNGLPTVATGDGTVSETLDHCVLTRDVGGNLNLYVNGDLLQQAPRGGDLSNWNPGYRLAVGGEPDPVSPRNWLGEFRLVAVYSRALTPTEVMQHYSLGADAPFVTVTAVPTSEVRFLAAAPNPFNARCALRVHSERPRQVEISVYDIQGRRVVTLAAKAQLEGGQNTFLWDGRNAAGSTSPSGTYFFRVTGEGWSEAVKVVMVK